MRYRPGWFCPWPVLQDASPDCVLLVLLPPRLGVHLFSWLLLKGLGREQAGQRRWNWSGRNCVPRLQTTRRNLELWQPLVLRAYSSDAEMSFGLEQASGQTMSGLGARLLVPSQNKDMATAVRQQERSPNQSSWLWCIMQWVNTDLKGVSRVIQLLNLSHFHTSPEAYSGLTRLRNLVLKHTLPSKTWTHNLDCDYGNSFSARSCWLRIPESWQPPGSPEDDMISLSHCASLFCIVLHWMSCQELPLGYLPPECEI